MKNKVMGKALSWVLSAAMALTMSGAIPAMTSTVYAAEPITTWANSSATAIAENCTINYGAKPSSDGLSASTLLTWKVKDTTSTDYNKTAGILNMVPSAQSFDAASYSSTAANTILGYFTATEQSAMQSTTIYRDGSNDQNLSDQTVGATTGVAVKLTDNGVTSTKIYFPCANEVATSFPSTISNKSIWTRDSLSGTKNSAAVDMSAYAASVTKAATGVGGTSSIAAVTSSAGTYYPIYNLDLSDRSKVLFKTATGTNYVLTEIGTGDQALATPVITKTEAGDTTGKANVTLSNIPTGATVNYFVTDLKDYTSSSATLKKVGTATVTNGVAAIDAGSNDLTSSYLFIYYSKTPVTGGTIYASTPAMATTNTIVTPTAANFSVGTLTYAGKTSQTNATAIENVVLPATYNASAKVIGDQGVVTVTKLVKDSKDVTLPATGLNAGTYEVWGTVAAGDGNDSSTSPTKFGVVATAIKLGDLVVKPYELATTNYTIALDAISQYAATPYTVAKLPLTLAADGTSGKLATTFATDKVNALNASVSVTAGTKSATNSSGTAAKVTISTSMLDNANFAISGTNAIVDSSVIINNAPMTGIEIAQAPTETTVVSGTAFNPAGLVLKATYEGDGTDYVTYGSGNSANFTFSPAITTNLLADTEFTVSYKDPVSGKSFTAPTKISVKVGSEAVLTSVSIPKTLTVNVGGSINIPTITYYPANVTGTKAITWTAATATNGIVSLLDNSGVVKADNTVATIKGVTAGTATLTVSVTVGAVTKTATSTVSVNAVNDGISWKRISGDSRYATAAAIAKATFTSAPTSAILVSGESFADALSASGLAGGLNAPILLTDPASLSSQTAALIKQWNLSTVYIVGGTAAVSDVVATSLKKDCDVTNVKRIYGNSRYETAEAVYTFGKAAGYFGSSVVITTGSKAADALSISPWAYSQRMPVLLAEDGALTGTSSTIIATGSFTKAYILGGTSAVNAATYSAVKAVIADTTRLSGNDRYETSAKIAQEFAGSSYTISNLYTKANTTYTAATITLGSQYNNTAFASGSDDHYVDALVGGMLQAKQNYVLPTGTEYYLKTGSSGTDSDYTKVTSVTVAAPILLVDGTSGAGFDLVESDYAKTSNNVSMLYVLGGTSAVTAATVAKITGNWTTVKEITD